jgi:hypothetical protein
LGAPYAPLPAFLFFAIFATLMCCSVFAFSSRRAQLFSAEVLA